jgi:GNAT superfamily N-acetyltransferase
VLQDSDGEVIREIRSDELRRDFFGLLGELEAGSSFDRSNRDHAAWLERLLEARRLMGARTFAAYTAEGEAAGFVTALFDEGPPGVASFGHKIEILDLGLEPRHLGRGAGARLLAHLEADGRGRKYHCLIVATYARAQRAIEFYVREGFVPVATLPDVHGPGDAGMLYLRKLL